MQKDWLEIRTPLSKPRANRLNVDRAIERSRQAFIIPDPRHNPNSRGKRKERKERGRRNGNREIKVDRVVPQPRRQIGPQSVAITWVPKSPKNRGRGHCRK